MSQYCDYSCVVSMLSVGCLPASSAPPLPSLLATMLCAYAERMSLEQRPPWVTCSTCHVGPGLNLQPTSVWSHIPSPWEGPSHIWIASSRIAVKHTWASFSSDGSATVKQFSPMEISSHVDRLKRSRLLIGWIVGEISWIRSDCNIHPLCCLFSQIFMLISSFHRFNFTSSSSVAILIVLFPTSHSYPPGWKTPHNVAISTANWAYCHSCHGVWVSCTLQIMHYVVSSPSLSLNPSSSSFTCSSTQATSWSDA